jgi:hypothetical protein
MLLRNEDREQGSDPVATRTASTQSSVALLGADVALVALSETKCHSQKPCCVRVSGVSGVSGVIF